MSNDTSPPDPVASTIPSPPPDFIGTVRGVPVFVNHASDRPAWFYTEAPSWDGFASEALDDDA